MSIENVYGQDVVNQDDDLLIAEAMAWVESFSNFIDDEEMTEH